MRFYEQVKLNYDKVLKIVANIQSLINAIQESLLDNSIYYILPLDKIKFDLKEYYLNYAYENFEEIPRDLESYESIINKAIQLKLCVKSDAITEVKKLLKILNSSNEKFTISKAIIHLYTCQSLFLNL